MKTQLKLEINCTKTGKYSFILNKYFNRLQVVQKIEKILQELLESIEREVRNCFYNKGHSKTEMGNEYQETKDLLANALSDILMSQSVMIIKENAIVSSVDF